MDQFIKQHRPIILALSAGIAIGAGGTIIYYKISRNASKGVDKYDQMYIDRYDRLCNEIKSLRSLIEKTVQSKSRAKRGYYSVHASSGEDDDDFEEAIDDFAIRREFEPLRTTAMPRSQNGNIKTSDINSIFAKVDKYLDGDDQDREKAYNILVENLSQSGRSADVLWRLAKASTFMAQIEGARDNPNGKQSLTYSALDHAKAALKLDAKNANVHKWYAITLGNIGDYEGTSSKIENGYVFKKHIEKAIELNPADPSSHYLLGRWCFGVYMLTWLERKAAATLYSTPPSATVDDALKHFKKAEDLSPGKWKDNMLHLAKCFIEKRDYSGAVDWLDQANAVPVLGQDDRDAQQEIDKLLYKYSGYRV